MLVFEQSLRIETPPQAVWDVLVDVERWPEWTASTRRVVRTDGGPFGYGSSARLWLRGSLGATEWRVTELTAGRSFRWESRLLPGLFSVAGHRISAEGDGTSLALSVTYTGPLSRVLAPFLAPVSRRNVRLEAEGLKRECERRAAALQ